MKIIMIVDTDYVFREKIEQELSQKGYHVVVAVDWRHCIDEICRLGKDIFDLVIINNEMRYMEGIELVGRIRNISEKYIPIIIYGSKDVEKTEEECKNQINVLFWNNSSGFDSLAKLINKIIKNDNSH